MVGISALSVSSQYDNVQEDMIKSARVIRSILLSCKTCVLCDSIVTHGIKMTSISCNIVFIMSSDNLQYSTQGAILHAGPCVSNTLQHTMSYIICILCTLCIRVYFCNIKCRECMGIAWQTSEITMKPYS